MSALLWLDTASDEAIELGDPLQLYADFAEMARVVGQSWQQDYAALAGVMSAVEDQEDVLQDWWQEVQEEAGVLLRAYGPRLGENAQWVLQTLSNQG